MANNVLTLGGLTARPGAKTVGEVTVNVPGEALALPAFLINGAQSGPTLVVTAGIHGAEYASIAAALWLGQTLQPASVHGRVLIVPVVNVPAFRARSIYICPLDGKNLNRVFPGDPDGSASQQIAHWLFQNVIKQGDYYVDLHGGDLQEALVPFSIYFRTGDAAVDDASLRLAQVFGIPYVVCSEVGGSTFSVAARAGVPGIIAEAGGQGVWRPDQVGLLTDGLQRVLRHSGIVPGGPLPGVPTQTLEHFVWLRSDHAGFWYPNVSVDEPVTEGQLLGEVRDFQGRVLQQALAPIAGRVLFLVSSLAINQGDPLLAVGS